MHCNGKTNAGELAALALSIYLQSGVDIEASSGRIHAGNILRIVDFFQAQFLTVIPGGGKNEDKKEKIKKVISPPPCFSSSGDCK